MDSASCERLADRSSPAGDGDSDGPAGIWLGGFGSIMAWDI
ncbi:hypothetical protein [Luteimonas sp. A478]